MTEEIKKALDEIMEIPPIFRRDYIIDYLRKNLPEEDARMHLFRKTKTIFLSKMMEQGLISRQDILEIIGRERIERFLRRNNN